LVLTYPREMTTPDRQTMRVGMSPFLREISPGLYNTLERGGAVSSPLTSQYPQDVALSMPPAAAPKVESARTVYQEGMRISHNIFGLGRITSIPGPRRVEVKFDRHGSKILHLDYAKLEIVG